MQFHHFIIYQLKDLKTSLSKLDQKDFKSGQTFFEGSFYFQENWATTELFMKAQEFERTMQR